MPTSIEGRTVTIYRPPHMDERERWLGCDPLRLTQQAYERWLRCAPDERGYHIAIGSSDVGPILGLSSYTTAADVYDKLLRQREGPRDRTVVRRGHRMEPVIVAEYGEETRRVCVHPQGPSYALVGDAVLRASPDREIVGLPAGDPQMGLISGGTGARIMHGVLEVKSLGANTFRELKEQGMDPSHYAQVQHQMLVTGKGWASYAALYAETWELKWFDVPRDEEFIDEMVEVLERFWCHAVMTRTRPVEDGTVGLPIVRPTPRLGRELVTIDNDQWRAAMDRLREAKERLTLAEQEYKLMKERFIARMEELGHEAIAVPGKGKVTYKESTSTKFDHRALRGRAPLDPLKVMEVLGLELGEQNQSILTAVFQSLASNARMDLSEFETRTSYRSFVPTFRE
jgi:predicted phage-related endonuclease